MMMYDYVLTIIYAALVGIACAKGQSRSIIHATRLTGARVNDGRHAQRHSANHMNGWQANKHGAVHVGKLWQMHRRRATRRRATRRRMSYTWDGWRGDPTHAAWRETATMGGTSDEAHGQWGHRFLEMCVGGRRLGHARRYIEQQSTKNGGPRVGRGGVAGGGLSRRRRRFSGWRRGEDGYGSGRVGAACDLPWRARRGTRPLTVASFKRTAPRAWRRRARARASAAARLHRR